MISWEMDFFFQNKRDFGLRNLVKMGGNVWGVEGGGESFSYPYKSRCGRGGDAW